MLRDPIARPGGCIRNLIHRDPGSEAKFVLPAANFRLCGGHDGDWRGDRQENESKNHYKTAHFPSHFPVPVRLSMEQ